MIYSAEAIDYKAGLDIYDSVEDKVYSEEEARKAPPEIRHRLTLRPRKLGTWVYELHEL